jgi:hypothetical protein
MPGNMEASLMSQVNQGSVELSRELPILQSSMAWYVPSHVTRTHDFTDERAVEFGLTKNLDLRFRFERIRCNAVLPVVRSATVSI